MEGVRAPDLGKSQQYLYSILALGSSKHLGSRLGLLCLTVDCPPFSVPSQCRCAGATPSAASQIAFTPQQLPGRPGSHLQLQFCKKTSHVSQGLSQACSLLHLGRLRPKHTHQLMAQAPASRKILPQCPFASHSHTVRSLTSYPGHGSHGLNLPQPRAGCPHPDLG